jgi:DNA-binding MarR family transcriptional regulator
MEINRASKSPGRATLLRGLLAELRALSSDTDALDEAAALRLGVARSDARGMDILSRRGALTVGELAAAVGLTYPAASALVDRMERAGYVTRAHEPGDRRRVVVRPTEAAARKADLVFSDLIASFARLADSYTDAELSLLASFIARSRAILRAQAERIRSEATGDHSERQTSGR